MSVNYTGLRNHLSAIHHNLAALELTDAEAVEQHHHEHYGPGGLRLHSHHPSLPPVQWAQIPQADQPPPAPESPPTFMTVGEVSEALRLSKMSVYRLVHLGVLPSKRVGRSFRIERAAYETYLANAEYHPEQETPNV